MNTIKTPCAEQQFWKQDKTVVKRVSPKLNIRGLLVSTYVLLSAPDTHYFRFARSSDVKKTNR